MPDVTVLIGCVAAAPGVMSTTSAGAGDVATRCSRGGSGTGCEGGQVRRLRRSTPRVRSIWALE